MIRAVDIIQKKRDGQKLSTEEINFLVKGFTDETIPSYQISAFFMACFFKPLSFDETMTLTKAMLYSGSVLDLSALDRGTVDKHSTGGVGDKTSLIIAPLAAACGVAVPMVSGRSLGNTGGTLDKLESMPGFNVDLTLDQFREYLEKIGVAMMGQTPELAPADKKMYALRDVTATVESIPLISASIMSKKLAEGTSGIVLDVKFGSGAFMKDFSQAKELAQWLVKIGKAFNKKMFAFVTDMNQPLGNKVGNSVEVEESIATLKGEGPEDLTMLSLKLAGCMIWLGGKAVSLEAGVELAKQGIADGRGLKKFQQMAAIQGGSLDLPKARFQAVLQSPSSGFILEASAGSIGKAASVLGCGRAKVGDPIDLSAGFTLHKKVGDRVKNDEPLLTIFYNDEKKRHLAEAELVSAFRIGQKPARIQPLIRETLGE